MPNHYVNELLILDFESDRLMSDPKTKKLVVDPTTRRLDYWREVLGTAEQNQDTLIGPVLPCKASGKERLRAWGTERGLYEAQPLTEIGGDFSGVRWTLESAWSAPHAAARRAVRDWLISLGAANVVWIGMNPSNDTVQILGYDVEEE